MEYFQFILDFVLHIDDQLPLLIEQYGTWIYAILFFLIFLETGFVVTPFLPGDSLLFVAGTLATVSTNHMNIHLLVLMLIIAAVLGDASNYVIGRYFGTRLFSNPNSKIFKQKYLEQTHAFYEKHGGKTIILARFVPIVRTFAPFVAGMGHMSYRHFAHYNIIGGVVWVTLITYIGYFLGSLEIVQKNLEIMIISIVIISILPAIIEIWKNKRKNKTA
ncbi:MAG: DedA family protein [Bacteroidetes bacterium]|nr:DedA family protein [Bacteroidota bacterium]